MCLSTGALQVLHLATCYFRGGYPGRPRTLHLREPLVSDRFWCSADRQTSLACFLGAGICHCCGWDRKRHNRTYYRNRRHNGLLRNRLCHREVGRGFRQDYGGRTLRYAANYKRPGPFEPRCIR